MATGPAPPPQDPIAQHNQCEKWLQHSLKDRFVRFVFDALDKKGCVLDPILSFECNPCSNAVGGGYVPNDKKIVLCENHLKTQKMTTQAILHEMLHAYDDCRAHVDWNNCVHHACSEIRTANLSGECSWWNEVQKGNSNIFDFKGKGMECVKRRAILSVKMNPACECAGVAEDAVDKAWKRCFADTQPFDRVP